jgi:hypothetical protein
MSDLLDGVIIIKGKALIGSNEVELKAIMYYATRNIKTGDNFKVGIHQE